MTDIDYSKLVPTDSFIGRYMAEMEEQETAQSYDFFCALWLMSLALRGCVVARPRAPVHLNFYIILVAESGTTRKSSAVRIGTSVARAYAQRDDVHLQLVEAKTTPEGLECALHALGEEHGYAQCAIGISELVTFLGREKYQLSMPGLLTDLYDCPEARVSPGTVTRGPVSLQHVYLSFLSASTPTWLARAVSPDVIEGGFTSRCLFIVEEQPKRRIAWPSADGERRADAMAARIAVHVRALCGFQARAGEISELGGIGINDQALAAFTRWYKTRTLHLDPFRASFESREDAHVLRIAACLCANDGSWRIGAQHLKSAIKVMAQIKQRSSAVFEGAGSRSRVLIGIDRLRDVLVEAGTEPVSQTKVYVACKNYLKATDVTSLLEIMHELDMVQRFEVGHSGAGRPRTMWRGTKNLLARDMMGIVMEQYDAS